MLKRTFDIVVGLIAVVLLAVPMLLIAVVIRLESPGRAIFRQRRAGWKGRPFTMLKFRTMRSDVDPYGVSPGGGDDPRLTRVGRFLRETSLDELPQLFNVLGGQMSLVGASPALRAAGGTVGPAPEASAGRASGHYRVRTDLRPGGEHPRRKN